MSTDACRMAFEADCIERNVSGESMEIMWNSFDGYKWRKAYAAGQAAERAENKQALRLLDLLEERTAQLAAERSRSRGLCEAIANSIGAMAHDEFGTASLLLNEALARFQNSEEK